MKKKKKVAKSISIDPDLLDQIIALAEKDGRSVSGLISKVMKEHTEKFFCI